MEFLSDYGLFLAKAITIVVAVVVIIGAIASAGQKGKPVTDGQIKVTHLSEGLKETADHLRQELLSKDEYKAYIKAQKQEEKEKLKKDKKKDKSKEAEEAPDKRLFVLNFEGDTQASAVDNLREEITAVLSIAEPQDEVLLRLESPGGMVHTYGLASSQLQRIKNKGIKLNIAVDEVAASGGYMMACVGDHIMAAPFAIIGSIGVLAQVPNFHRLLKEHNVDFEMHTAGEYKRTLTMFGENTDKARSKFLEELEDTHKLFKQFIIDNRSQLDVEKVATGEHWYGSQAIDLDLIDEIKTSDDFLVEWSANFDAFEVEFEIKKSISERLAFSIKAGVESAITSLLQKDTLQRLFK
ncbi:protease SohB [Pleionea sp. CnH1-48]|uniref:protease SohB n=1 Tax=Pleionea sp. CnH1-48 TaxID=2954494 RepID=UPI002097AFF3|nr:protease SohB [Pleionea sp. CnH1-48]MCO7225414.1 protease SohB [Pleionea sp. CnH1-48]